MSAEELKAKVREYADEHLPGWACAGVSFRLGEIGASVTETLVVLPPCGPVTAPIASPEPPTRG